MKNTILSLLLILFQSCYSYKSIDLNKTSLVVGKKYKIQENNKFIKVKLIGLNDSVANFKMNNTQKQINLSEIEKVKMLKFSVGKTILLPVTIVVSAITIFALTFEFRLNMAPVNNTPL